MTETDLSWSDVKTCTVLWSISLPGPETIYRNVNARLNDSNGTGSNFLDEAVSVTAHIRPIDSPPIRVVDLGNVDLETLTERSIEAALCFDVGVGQIEILRCDNGCAILHSHGVGDAFVATRLVIEILDALELAERFQDTLTPDPSLLRLGFDTARGLRSNIKPLMTMSRSGKVPASDNKPSDPGLDATTTGVVAQFRHYSRPEKDGRALSSLRIAERVAGTIRTTVSADPDWYIMVSLRRYSASLGKARGNQVGVLSVKNSELSDGGRTVSDLRSRIELGEPLVRHLAHRCRTRLSNCLPRRKTKVRNDQPTDTSPQQAVISWSDRGHNSASLWDSVKWSSRTADDHAQVYAFATPTMPGKTSLNLAWVDGRCCVTQIGTEGSLHPSIIQSAVAEAFGVSTSPPVEQGFHRFPPAT
ncbi:hypothetical protein [Gordonia sp. NPDC003422]